MLKKYFNGSGLKLKGAKVKKDVYKPILKLKYCERSFIKFTRWPPNHLSLTENISGGNLSCTELILELATKKWTFS